MAYGHQEKRVGWPSRSSVTIKTDEGRTAVWGRHWAEWHSAWWTDSTSCLSPYSSWESLIFIRRTVLLATTWGRALGGSRASGRTSGLAVAIVLWFLLIAVPMGSSDCQLSLLTAHIRQSCSSSTLLGFSFQDHVCLVLWRGSPWPLL